MERRKKTIAMTLANGEFHDNYEKQSKLMDDAMIVYHLVREKQATKITVHKGEPELLNISSQILKSDKPEAVIYPLIVITDRKPYTCPLTGMVHWLADTDWKRIETTKGKLIEFPKEAITRKEHPCS
jgi:hypothetical protein